MPATKPLKIYDLEFTNTYPYEQAVAVRIADPNDRIVLDTDNSGDHMYRIYRNHPYQYVNWSLVEGLQKYDYSPESICGRGGDIWIQTEYVVFGSHHRPDDTRLDKLRRKLKRGGLDAIPFPPAIRPDNIAYDGLDDGFHTFRLEGDLKRKSLNTLYVSQLSSIPIINNHTIPEEIDFAWVCAEVVTYRSYVAIPTYVELLETLEQYSECLEKLIDLK